MNKIGFLRTGIKDQCFGCEACVQICGRKALKMDTDQEGFRYPVLDRSLCVDCGLCNKVCPVENRTAKHTEKQIAYGGYIKSEADRLDSTSGGAFTAIADAWADRDYVIFGAVSDGLRVVHSYIADKALIEVFRKSKYSQSVIGSSFADASRFLRDGKKVLFSGTPCQISGLINYLNTVKAPLDNLLTVEVVCEGVPSPLYIEKMNRHCIEKYGAGISRLSYRHKAASRSDFSGLKIGLRDKGKWDFQMMKITLSNGIEIVKDRWFTPFWSIWLNHLMSRPSCYNCPFTTAQRVSDITLGDLWGVHIYCPELYGNNGGSSLIVANTDKGRLALDRSRSYMHGHELDFETALRYQSPMRKPISYNPERETFMKELMDTGLTYADINKKWAKPPTLKLLYQKYIWGNRQKVALWNLKHKGENHD